MYTDRLSGLLTEADFARIYQKARSERCALEERQRELKQQMESPVPVRDRAKELVRRFVDSEFANRELLVSLIERVELTEEKEIFIHFRFPELSDKN